LAPHSYTILAEFDPEKKLTRMTGTGQGSLSTRRDPADIQVPQRGPRLCRRSISATMPAPLVSNWHRLAKIEYPAGWGRKP
jgi:hypothetical protein